MFRLANITNTKKKNWSKIFDSNVKVKGHETNSLM